MNRFRKAWLALNDKLPEPSPITVEKVVTEFVIGDASITKLYRVQVYREPPGRGMTIRVSYERDCDLYYYTTCEAAYAAHHNACVTQIDAVKIGGKYLPIEGTKKLVSVNVVAKPKVAKGRRQ